MFLVKKILASLLMPIPLAILLLLLAMLLWRRKPWLSKGLVVGAMVWLVMLSSSIGSYWLLWPLEHQYTVNTTAHLRGCVVMVLGSGHDDTIEGDARQKLSTTALARLNEGLAQLKSANSSDCLLAVSGWNGGLDQQSHAQRMQQAAVELGANPGRMLVLADAKDTIEEALALRQSFGSSAEDKGEDAVGGRQLILVTSAAHMPRAMRIFHLAGLTPVAAPTDFLARRDHWWRLSTENLDNSAKAIHEYLGLLWIDIRLILGM